jgi:hypothetical protein
VRERRTTIAWLVTSTLVFGRKPIASFGSPRGVSVSITISQSVPSLASGMVNVIGAGPALNSSRNFRSVTRSPRGSGSVIADPLRKTATDFAYDARQSASVISSPVGVSQAMSTVLSPPVPSPAPG